MADGNTRNLGPGPPPWARRVPERIILGRYRIQAEFESNRNTKVSYAEDLQLPGRRLVVKALVRNSSAMTQAFDAERDILAGLNHPAIARLYADATEGSVRYLVEEFHDRSPLSGRKLSPELALDTVMSLLDVVEYLHQRNPPVIHADIKPGNVLQDEFGQVTLIDFDAAHVGESAPARQIQATPGYACPEQLSGGAPRKTWDLFACAALLHQLLSGIDPASWQGRGMPPIPEVPEEVTRVLRCCLSSNPRDRLRSARDFRHALERARAFLTGHRSCPKCGQEQAGGVSFCHRCGSLLLQGKLPRGNPSRTITRSGMDRFLNDLQSPRFVTRGTLELRMEADALARPLGFDALMSVDHLSFEPHRHQLQVLKKALKNHLGRSMLADEVGLGKTIEAGLVREELVLRGLVQTTLVLVPASLREQWQEELQEKFGVRFDIYDNSTRSKLRLEKLKSVIISLDMATRSCSEALLGRRWDLVIVDEAHHARNRTTKRWAFLEQLDKSYFLLLTATPLQNKLEELFNLISILRPGLLGTSPKDFEKRYGVDGRSARRDQQLRSDLEKAMIRTRRAQAYVRFPERQAYVRSIEPTRSEAQLYEDVTNLVRELAEEHRAAKPWQLQLIHLQQRATSSPEALAESLGNLSGKAGRLAARVDVLQRAAERQRGQSSKLDNLVSILEQVKDRVVVFTDHVPTQKMLCSQLQERKYRTTIFRGSAAEKQRALKEFAEAGQVMVVSQAGNEGLNLQKHCHILVNYDLPWNPMRIEQRIGRVQRLGQPRDVMVFNLAVQNTVEEHVLDVLEQKIRLFEISVGQLDLILGEQLSDESAFAERIFHCLLQARGNVELRKALEREFQKEAKLAENLDEIESASDILGF